MYQHCYVPKEMENGLRNKIWFRALICLAAICSIVFILYLLIGYGLGFRPFDDPPRVGEPVEEVVQRLGPPHYDSRNDNSKEIDKYQLGYTDGIGTRYHLMVENGVIQKIEYSSR